MKRKTLVIVLIVLAVLIAAAAVCWIVFGPKPDTGLKTLTVEITHSDATIKTYTIKTDEEYLCGAMEQENLIDGTEGEFGLYVLTVDGETVDEAKQEWWGYTRSGEYVEYGVDQCPIADGEHYEFTFNTGW